MSKRIKFPTTITANNIQPEISLGEKEKLESVREYIKKIQEIVGD